MSKRFTATAVLVFDQNFAIFYHNGNERAEKIPKFTEICTASPRKVEKIFRITVKIIKPDLLITSDCHSWQTESRSALVPFIIIHYGKISVFNFIFQDSACSPSIYSN